MASCPSNPPPPSGYKIWKGAVPTPLTQWAMQLRDHIRPFPYGQTWGMNYGGESVIARKDYHSWTYNGGRLQQNICIPGITLYAPAAGPKGLGAAQDAPQDPVTAEPDPTLAVYGATDVVDWPAVAFSGLALALVVGGFYAGLMGLRGAKTGYSRRLGK